MELERLHLDPTESQSLLNSASAFLGTIEAFEEASSAELAAGHHECLPTGLRAALHRLRSDSPTVAVVLSGVPLGGLDDVPTPQAFGHYSSDERSRRAEAILFLLASAVGTPFSFASQQKARIVLDVFPMPGHESDQLGCSSATFLEWHNEDAFHPLRADFNILMCVRNDQGAATTLVAAADLGLNPEVEEELRRPQFAIVPDVSHSYSYNSATSGVSADCAVAFSRISEMAEDLLRLPVLTGPASDPGIRVDFAYMPPELHTRAANAALKTLQRAVERTGTRIPLAPGDVLVFDNMRCVHGRESFLARYDGTDRWMRRMNIARGRTVIDTHRLAIGRLQIA